jgi:hypothetical protein
VKQVDDAEGALEVGGAMRDDTYRRYHRKLSRNHEGRRLRRQEIGRGDRDWAVPATGRG